jgi:putative transposase
MAPDSIREISDMSSEFSNYAVHRPAVGRTITATQCGRIGFGRRKIHLGTVFAGQKVGVEEVDDKIWLVSFMQYDLGFFDHETGVLESVQNPIEARVLPMSPV